jgi:hypothetical protein
MSERPKPPIWLRLAAAALIVSGGVLVVTHFVWLVAFFVAVDLLLAWLLIRGSRFGWTLFGLGEASTVVLFALGSGTWWNALLAVLLLACLFMPSSLAYVWRQRTTVVRGTAVEARFTGTSAGALTVAGWGRLRRFVGEKVTWVSALVAFLVLSFLGTLVSGWEQGSASNNTIVAILGHGLLTTSRIAFIVCIVLAIGAARRAWARRRLPPNDDSTQAGSSEI